MPVQSGLCCILLALGLCGIWEEPAHAQSLVQSAFSSGGGLSSGGTWSLESSFGQATPVGRTFGGGIELVSGFLTAAAPGALAPLVTDVSAPSTGGLNAAVPISIEVGSEVPVDTVLLIYRRGGGREVVVGMEKRSETSYQTSIPAVDVTSEGLSYSILARSATGGETRVPAIGSFSLRTRIEGAGLASGMDLPGGERESAYRLVSFPLRLQNNSPGAILEDDLGAYDPARWRLFGLSFDQRTVELPDLDSLAVGEGYWLIVKESGRTIDTGPGTTVPINRPFGIPLYPRWNLIGNPYSFPIDVSQLQTKSGEPLDIRAFEGRWNNPLTEPITVLEPFKGYAVYSDISRVDSLLIFPPALTGQKSSSATLKAGAAADEQEWRIHLHAGSEGSWDADNIFGVASAASSEWDHHDYAEPPAFGRSVSVYFPHPEWERSTDRFTTDLRSPGEIGYIWSLSVEAQPGRSVDLSFSGLESLPASMEAWLLDETAGVKRNLRTSAAYAVVGTGTEMPRRIKVVVGPKGFAQEQSDEIAEAPGSLLVEGGFPNPFSRSTTVRYGIPESGSVSIFVYDVLGRVVTMLMNDEPQEAGYHTVIWDGHTRAGGTAPSGVYMVVVRAGGNQAAAKLVITR